MRRKIKRKVVKVIRYLKLNGQVIDKSKTTKKLDTDNFEYLFIKN